MIAFMYVGFAFFPAIGSKIEKRRRFYAVAGEFHKGIFLTPLGGRIHQTFGTIPYFRSPSPFRIMQELKPYLSPSTFLEENPKESYAPGQIGNLIRSFSRNHPALEEADLFLLGCGEYRGEGGSSLYPLVADRIREEFYTMYSWHEDIAIADLGNLNPGHSWGDSLAALKIVLEELHTRGKKVMILGGSHDLCLAQYQVYRELSEWAHLVCVDSLVDLDESEAPNSRSFLMDLFTEHPSFLRHYSHIGFQTYYNHPSILESLDKLRFDLYRLGKVREQLDEMEPVLRTGDILAFDMQSIRYADAPYCEKNSPNGLSGEEACSLMRYAGMAQKLNSLGIYGVHPDHDSLTMTSRLIAQMLWYYVDGLFIRNREADLNEKSAFYQFHLEIAEVETLFLKSKKSNRWWMTLPNQSIIPCSYSDYLAASSGNIPERWFREQERLL